LLDNQVRKNSKATLDSINSVSRILPILSVDSGLYLERDLDLAGTALKHSIEPHLFYLYIPRTNQNDIPLFDSNVSDFRYNTMFRENRFSGTDRVQDANQITLALTSRLLDPATGLERLKVNIGNILYLQNRDVTLSYLNDKGEDQPYRPEKTAFNHQTFSNVITEVSSQFNQHFSADAGMQWNPRTNKVERGNIGLHFVNNPGELINLGFQFRKDDALCTRGEELKRHAAGYPITPGCESIKLRDPTPAELTDLNNPNNPNNPVNNSNIILSDVSIRWPLFDDWYGIGRWQYSWAYDRTQEAFLGLEKENCCWRFRIIGRHYFNGLTNPGSLNSGKVTAFNLATAEAQTGVFFQIELKGLTGLGQKLDDFFERNIYGYQKPQK
jgi:LPS-assembly protein